MPSREIGGAAGIHSIFVMITSHYLIYRNMFEQTKSWNLVSNTRLYRRHMLFSKNISTHKRYKCVRGAENIHGDLMFGTGVRLVVRKIVKSNGTKKCDNTKQYDILNYMLFKLKKWTVLHPSYISDLVPIYVSSIWRCAYGAGVFQVPIACTVLVYLSTEIFVGYVQYFKFHTYICTAT